VEIKKVRSQFHLRPERQAAFDALISCMRARTPWLRPSPGTSRAGWSGPVFLINRLRNLAERQGQWRRVLDDWAPLGESLRVQFRSLASHLLGIYPVPA